MDLFKLGFTTPPAINSLDYSEKTGDIIFVINASLES